MKITFNEELPTGLTTFCSWHRMNLKKIIEENISIRDSERIEQVNIGPDGVHVLLSQGHGKK